MFKSKIFASELEMETSIGDVEDMGAIINSGETIVDNYNNGDKSVLSRLGGMMSSDITVDGEFAEAVFDNDIEDVAIEEGSDITHTGLIDKWTGLLYDLVKKGDVEELYYVTNWRVVVKPFETKNENDEVVMSFNLGVYEELKDGKWVSDEDTNEMILKNGFMKHASNNINFTGAFNE
jgi:hypothetical protein